MDHGEATQPPFEVAIIGTSPMCMLEAISHRLTGARVILIDRAPVYGGAWQTLKMFGQNDLENGPHFLLHPEGIRFLQEDLGLDLVEVMRPRWINCRQSNFPELSDSAALFHVGLRQISSVGETLGDLFRRGKLRDARRIVRTSAFAIESMALAWKLYYQRPASYYFRNGSGPVVKSLTAYAKEIGVEFRMNTEVTKIEVAGGAPAVLHLVGHETVRAQHVVLTEHSCVPILHINNLEHRLKIKPRQRTQLHFSVTTRNPLDFYIVRFLSQKYFLLSNLAKVYSEALLPQNQTLLTLALLDTTQAHHITREQMQEIVQDLIDYRVLPTDTSLNDFEATVYDDSKIHPKSLKWIANRHSSRLKVFGHPDLSVLLAQRCQIWRQRGMREGCLGLSRRSINS